MPHNLGRPACVVATPHRCRHATESNMPHPLPAHSLLIEGSDAIAFAQSQFTGNVLALATGQWQFNAWLNAQGRVRALFHLARLDDQRLLLLLRGGETSAFIEALRRYVFRSRITLTPAPWRTLATDAALPLHELRSESTQLRLGCGTHSLRLGMQGDGDDDWRAPQWQLGWPWLPPAQLEALLPASLSLHRLQAVALDKGCYPGQEIVARMHWRGGNKRHLCRVQLAREAQAGDNLRLDGRDIGVLLDVLVQASCIVALAVLDDGSSAHDTWLTLDDTQALCVQQRWEN